MKRISAVLVPPITLDRRGTCPIYRQLYDWFRSAIAEGRVRPGQGIPSTRRIAAELQISRISVFNAYEQLQSEGYLETSPGSGTRVAATIPDDAFGVAPPQKRTGTDRVIARLGPRKLSARAAALLKAPSETWLHNLGPFRVSLPALDRFPVDIWSKLVARHSRRLSRSVMAYGDAMGHLPFREAIAEYLSTFRGVRCDSSQILVTTGSQQALQISAQVLLNPKDQLLMEEPGYPGARLAFTAVGVELIPAPVDSEGMIVPEISQRGLHARVAYVTPSHQYPLGMTMSAARRMSLLQWAVRSDAWIIEDDYDSEYRFGSRPIASLQGLDLHGRVIYIGTFSKVLFPSLRLGYVVVPKDLLVAFRAVRDATDIFSSTLYQVVLIDFIREGHFARHIRRMRMLYMDRRKALVGAIRSQMGGILEVIGADAGMHLVALLPQGLGDVSVSKYAAQNGISAMPLSSCYLKAPKRGGLILGYGGVNPRQIQDGIRKLRISMHRNFHQLEGKVMNQ
jgi:GntR family transcriptional regulator / MocR family aminotransferase